MTFTATTIEKIIVAATDRSMRPVSITTVMPSASRPKTDTLRRRFSIFWPVR